MFLVVDSSLIFIILEWIFILIVNPTTITSYRRLMEKFVHLTLCESLASEIFDYAKLLTYWKISPKPRDLIFSCQNVFKNSIFREN